MRNDTVTGHATFRVGSRELRTGRACEIACVNRAVVGDMEVLHDSISALLTADSLIPISSFQIRKSFSRTDTVISRYDRGRVSLATNGGKKLALDAPPNTFDNSILVMAIRALDMKPGARYALNSLASFAPWVKPADVEVLGLDTTTVPAGKYVCHKVALEIAGHRLFLWYDTSAAKRYIRFENPAGNSSAVLTRQSAPGRHE